MNRLLLFFLFLSASCATTKSSKQLKELNGVWIPIKQEIGGKDLPAVAYQNYKLTITDSIYTYTDHDKGAIFFDHNKIDIYGREGVNAGKHFTAIYKLEQEQLTICYNLSGDSYPTAFETKSKPTLFLSVYKKK